MSDGFALWGHKSVAFLDVWSIEHVIMGISIGAFCIKFADYIVHRFFTGQREPKRLRNFISVLFLLSLAFYWEVLEHYLEVGLLGPAVEHWFAGVEHWSNRLISDILVVLLGYWLYVKYVWLEWPARAFSVVWLGTHIFIFPDSMYLHTAGIF